jgi:hypothetical protein
VAMDQFGLYPLSSILSFLSETEGCSFLITNSKWKNQILPLFRFRDKQAIIPVVNALKKKTKHRHKFVVAPVQDADTRLDRLNTRRWRKRNLHHTNKTTLQVAVEEWRHPSAFPPLLRFWPRNSPHMAFQPGITLLLSYPRSGNTLLRSLLEGVTGLVTASDTRADRTLSRALADQHDLAGEGLCIPPICKTHWPERRGCRKFHALRAVLVVRNPFDAIVSYWNLNLTNTHTEKVTEEIYDRFQDFFQAFVRNEMKVWLDFLKFWATRSDIPVLMVRYEDLILNPRSQLERILNFYAKGDKGMPAADVWKDRIDIVLANQNSHGYQSSSDNKSHSSVGRSVSTRYTPELLTALHSIDQDGWLKRLGYHVYHQNFPNNLDSLPVLGETTGDNSSRFVLINQSEIDLRPSNCPYGRLMRDWRRKRTNDDREPFPTIPRKR